MRSMSQEAAQGLHEAGNGNSPKLSSRAPGSRMLFDADFSCCPGSFLGRAAGRGTQSDRLE